MNKIVTKFVIISLLAVLVLLNYTFNTSQLESQEDYGMGLLPVDEDDYEDFDSSSNYFLRGVGDTKRSVSYKSEMPPVKNQFRVGSCTGWASGYYSKTHQEYMDRGNWNVYDSNHQAAPLDIYNGARHYGYGLSSDIGIQYYNIRNKKTTALGYIEEFGVLPFSYFPYIKEKTKTPPYDSNSRKRRDTFRINSVEKLTKNTWQITNKDIENMKIALSNKGTILIAANVKGLSKYAKDGMINESDATKIQFGPHAMCVVGYDDDKGLGGAFEVVNSWGKDFGDEGYFWLTYDAFKIIGMEAYVMNDKPSGRNPDDVPGDKILDIEIEVKPKNTSTYIKKNVDYNDRTGFYTINYNFNIGDKYKLYLTSEENYSINFINIDPSGEFNQLFPESGYSSSIYADKKYRFPMQDGMAYGIVDRGGAGIGTFAIIVSNQNLNDLDLEKDIKIDVEYVRDSDELQKKAFPELNSLDETAVYALRMNFNE